MSLTRFRLRFVEKVFIVLSVILLLLASVDIAKAQGKLISSHGEIIVRDGVIDLDDLTIEQKVAQMIVVAGQSYHKEAWDKLGVGGIHMYAHGSASEFKSVISSFQEGKTVPYLVSVDLEGCLNPLAAFYQSVPAANIRTPGEAFQKGVEDGMELSRLGFTLNYAPVVDLEDTIWGCRTFPGTVEDKEILAQSYILGLQDTGVIATAKHYPGQALVISDPHKFLVSADITSDDVAPYEYLFRKGDVKAVMVTHVIGSGVIDSHGVPAVVDPEVISSIRSRFDGLIITDEIMMLGLKNYFSSTDDMYLAVFKAGSDVVLNFNEDPYEIEKMITVVSGAVRSGEIDIHSIDASVTRILEAKGFIVQQ